MTNEQKIKKLSNRKEQLEEKYYYACKKEHERINNMGWGYGMRHSKINFSTRKSDSIRKKIEMCDMEIQQLKNEMQSQIISTIINHNINK
jgi:flagellar biosynthesis/type III secretory pathway protein FliH